MPLLFLRRLRPRDAFHDHFFRLTGIAPAQNLHPFAGFKILVVGEEMLNLLHGDFRQVQLIENILIAPRQPGHGHGNDLFIAARLVLHLQNPHRAAGHDSAGNDAALVGDQHVNRVAIA